MFKIDVRSSEMIYG